MNKYIALDTETGGIGPEVSLLTAYLAVFDENLNRVGDIYLKVKPDNELYVLQAKALEVNKIDIVTHDAEAITYSDAKHFLYNFLKTHYMGEKLIPIGHGVVFDIRKIQQHLISIGSWENFVSYRSLDTSPIARFLIAAGLVPDSVKGSLESLVEHFGLPPIGDLHDARIDTLMTVEVLKKLLGLIKPV